MKLNHPNLVQLIYLAQNMTAAEVVEHMAISGRDYNPEALAIRCHSYNGPAHVLLANGRPYYVGGFTVTAANTAQAWSIATDECAKHVLEMTRAGRRIVNDLLEAGVHRIQMSCLEAREPARRWYEALGAKHEATLHAAGKNGENVVVYSIVKDESHVPAS